MTGTAWLQAATQRLRAAGCEDAAFDARCLLEDVGGVGRGGAAARELDESRLPALAQALREREQGRPLQYILGNWDFLSLTLAVGEGVLIPRPDTELLCEIAAGELRDCESPRVLDLCAGSGCVGLGVASLCPGAQVTAVELSEEALVYLRRNCEAYSHYGVTVRQGDVLAGPTAEDSGYDAILSNPPYIPTADLSSLQREVQREPAMALDGSADGLTFYRAICRRWLGCLKPGGLLAVEIGIGQAEAVASLFEAAGLSAVTVSPDLAGIPRVVWGKK